MKILYVLTIQCLITTSIFSQENDFKIGMCGVDYYSVKVHNGYLATSNTLNGEYTSSMGQLSEDGFNLINTYEPWIDISKQNFKNLLLNAQSNGMQVVPHVEKWFRPYHNGADDGYNIYNIDKENKYFLNFNDFFDDVICNNSYSSIIYGIYTASESNANHGYPAKSNVRTKPSDWIHSKIPPYRVNEAIEHFSFLKNRYNHSKHIKIIQAQATHGGNYVTDDTPSSTMKYLTQDYFKITNNGDIQVEQTYYNWDFRYYTSTEVTAEKCQRNKSLQGKFISIDYEKRYYDNIHTDIHVPSAYKESGGTIKPPYRYITSTNPDYPNYNHIWFQAYTSIIHGVKGVWFWSLGNMFTNESDDKLAEQNFKNKNFEFENFPKSYKIHLRHLAREIRYLKEIGIVSTDESTILHTKTTSPDELGIVPHVKTYLPEILDVNNARDLFSINDWGNSVTEPNPHTSDEFYGLRYTLRTNGTDVFMIISNPNPVILKDVVLDFNNVFEISGAWIYFEKDETGVASTSYKANRDSGIDWKNKTVRDTTYISTLSNKINLDFGPIDVHVLKLKLKTGWNDHMLLPQSNKVEYFSDFVYEDNKLYYVTDNHEIERKVKTKNGGWKIDEFWQSRWEKVWVGTGIDVAKGHNDVIFYVGANQRLRKIFWNGNWQNIPLSGCIPNGQTEIHVNSTDKVYFNNDKNQLTCTQINGDWCGPISLSAPKMNPSIGFDLEDHWSDPIYYADENNRNIYKIHWSSGYHVKQLTNGPNHPRLHSEIKMGSGMGFFVNDDGKICPFYDCGGIHMCTGSLHPSDAPLVKRGTGIFVEKLWNNPIYYIGDDNNIYRLYWDGHYKFEQLTSENGIGATQSYTDIIKVDGKRVFYVGSDRRIHSIKFTNGSDILKSTDEKKPKRSIKYFDDYVIAAQVNMRQVKLKINPNITSRRIELYSPSKMEKIILLDTKGTVLQIFEGVNDSEFHIEIEGIQKGLYFIQAYSTEGMTIGKFIKK